MHTGYVVRHAVTKELSRDCIFAEYLEVEISKYMRGEVCI